ncbi:putative ribonuclease H-like domain-containing protein, partial [Tanacetum coccineum]
VNTVRPRVVNTARPNRTSVNAARANGFNAGNPQHDDKGFVDSGCSRHMTGNIAYLSDFKQFDGCYVAFGGGFKDPDHPDKVYKVVKALYGLHQAPRAWYETLANYLLSNGFKRGKIDQTLFIKKQKGDILLVQVYVDDIIFGSTNKELCTGFEKLMKDKFQMSSMGELTFFLGLQVQQKEDGIFISQDKYVAEILKKFNYSDVKSASTLVDLEKPLVKDGDANDVDVHLYRSMIGSLMYLTASRPDIMFAVCACARFQVTPKTSHLLAVKRIFRYLKGKPTQDRKSTTGGCQVLGNRLISWQCRKQTVVATSTTEAEYVAAANCYGQVKHVEYLMLNASPFEVMFEKKVNGLESQCLNFMFEITFEQSIDPPLSRGYTLGSGKDSMTLIGIDGILHMLMMPVQVSAVEGDSINTSATAKVQTVNGVRQLQALVDKKRVIITELARMGYEKPSQKLTFYKAFFSPQWKYFIHTITQCLSAKSTAWDEFSSSMASLIICNMSTHKKIFVNPFHTKKVFANMKRAGKDFSRRITPLFDTMMVQPVEEMGEDSDYPTDSTPIPIIDQPSSSSQHKKDKSSKKAQSQEAEVPQDEAGHEESVLTPSNDPQPSGEDIMKLTELMVLCTKL